MLWEKSCFQQPDEMTCCFAIKAGTCFNRGQGPLAPGHL